LNKITVFNYLSLDGHYCGPNGETGWFQDIRADEEWSRFSQLNAGMGDTLLLGRRTYEMMRSFWPTPEAQELDPGMAKEMNGSPKVVFSKSLKESGEGPRWKNVKILPEIKKDEILNLKAAAAGDLVVLGSGSVVQQLAALGLIEVFSLVLVPRVLGKGRPFFASVGEARLELLEERSFKNGIVFLRYGRLSGCS
jgi:dihydrofolate reductase